jgi:hypothetical protein
MHEIWHGRSALLVDIKTASKLVSRRFFNPFRTSKLRGTSSSRPGSIRARLNVIMPANCRELLKGCGHDGVHRHQDGHMFAGDAPGLFYSSFVGILYI